jgi:hypothetical protein
MTNRPENFRVEDTEEYKLLEWEFEQMTKSYDKIWDSFEEIQIIYSNKKQRFLGCRRRTVKN